MSSEVDFQNGFICGMATKGLIKGSIYSPIVWNDFGIYTHFYIDFKRGLLPFSLGMLEESLIVHDSTQLAVTKVEKISESVYKLVCDIAGKNRGITVLNKATSFLKFLDGHKVPVFSIHIFIAGIVPYIDYGYLYEYATLPLIGADYVEYFNNTDWFSIETASITETIQYVEVYSMVTENINMSLT